MRDSWRSRATNRLRTEGPAALAWSLRVTVAAVASYLVAIAVFPGQPPLLAPLTALLVVQVTPVSLLASGLDRVVAVVAGVAVAVAFAAATPLEWWSLGLLILVSITIGQALRLRDNLMEVAISGMLVLGVGAYGAGTAAWQRIAETLVGAAVGIAGNLLFPPKVASADAGRAIDGLADSVSDLLNGAADELTELVEAGRDPGPAARRWLDEARRINHDIPNVGAALLHAEQGRRLNVRAVGTPNVGPGLRQGLEALEHAAVTVRGMFRALADAAEGPVGGPAGGPPGGRAGEALVTDDGHRDLLLGLAQTLRDMGAGVDAFGQLVHDEADPGRRMTPVDLQALTEALEGLHEARARLEDLLTTGTPPELLEPQAAVLSAVKRLLREMDLDERLRRQLRLVPPVRPRRSQRMARAVEPAAPEQPEGDAEAETQVLPRIREES